MIYTDMETNRHADTQTRTQTQTLCMSKHTAPGTWLWHKPSVQRTQTHIKHSHSMFAHTHTLFVHNTILYTNWQQITLVCLRMILNWQCDISLVDSATIAEYKVAENYLHLLCTPFVLQCRHTLYGDSVCQQNHCITYDFNENTPPYPFFYWENTQLLLVYTENRLRLLVPLGIGYPCQRPQAWSYSMKRTHVTLSDQAPSLQTTCLLQLLSI